MNKLFEKLFETIFPKQYERYKIKKHVEKILFYARQPYQTIETRKELIEYTEKIKKEYNL